MERPTLVGHLRQLDLGRPSSQEVKYPFRDAYHITGEIVNLPEDRGVDISELQLKDLQSIEPKLDGEALEILDNRRCMDSRDSLGGTSTEQTLKQIDSLKDWLLEEKRGDLDV